MRQVINPTRGMLCLAAFITAVEAQEPDLGNGTEEVYQLEEFIVTGTGVPLLDFETAADVNALYGEEKLRRQSANLGEMLEHLPSVSSISTGSGVGKPVIRGLTDNRVRVLQDGVGVNYQQFGVRHPPNLDPFLTERVEVVRGVSSILYGSDAFGGAVNAISPSIQYSEGDSWSHGGRATYRYESGNDLHTGALLLDLARENWGLTGGIVRRDAGNLTVPDVETWGGPPPTGQPSDIPRFADELDFTDFEQTNGMLKGGYRFDSSEITVRYERWEHKNNYLLPNGRGIGVNLENNLIQAEMLSELSGNWEGKASYTWNQNLRRANAGGTPLPVRSPEDIDLERNSHTLRGELIYQSIEDRYSGTVGLEGIYEDQKSRGLTGLTPGGQIENLAVFGLGRINPDPWTFEAGLRYDRRSQEADPSQTADADLLENRIDPVTSAPVDVNLENQYDVFSASLGAIYQVNESLALAANVNRGFRAPGLFELYADGVHGGVAAVQFGQADLEEETSLGGDFQVRWRSERLDWTATAYVTDISNFIFLGDTGATNGGGLPIFKVGQADATLVGGDLSASFRATDWLTIKGSYEIVRGEFADGGDVPLLPADQLQLEAVLYRESLGWMETPEFRIGIRHARSKDAAGALEPFSQFDNNPNFGTASTDAYTLLDLGLSFNYRDLRLDLMVKNATDEDYRDFLDTYKGYALSPGRNLILQTSLAF